MSLQDLAAGGRGAPETGAVIRRGMRMALVGFGILIMVVGTPVALLPWLHLPGALIVATGLVIVLRNSFTARRHFIRAQRRHPKIVFPIRRMMRRQPEILPVVWQQLLRTERLILPRRARFCIRARRAVFRRRRA